MVLISIDTLRSDRLPAYGYDGVDTPAIDALATDGVVFEHAYSPCPLTLPAHATLLTGLLPPEHGVRDNAGYRLDADEHPYLPRLLRVAGYRTGGFVSAFVLDGANGLDAGFEIYDDDVETRGAMGMASMQRSGNDTLAAARVFLDDAADAPFFLFLHLYEPHTPYTPPAPFAERYDDPYDGEIAAADAVVGALLDDLRARGVYDRALVVLVSDHGEGLGDHGEDEHGILLYREALQVPLIVKLPAGEMAGRRVTAPAQLADVPATVLQLLELEPPPALAGRSLLPLLAGDAPARTLYAETYHPRLRYGWSELLSVIDGDRHYIQGPDPELYDLETDPAETRNLLRDERRRLATLRAALEDVARAPEPPAAVDAETAARLAALGYAAASAPERAGPLPDPKTRLPLLRRLDDAQAKDAAGRHEEARAELASLVAEEPGMADAWIAYGLTLVHLERPREAIPAYENALALAGPTNALLVRLASLYATVGEPGRAVELLEGAVAAGHDHPEVLARLGVSLVEAGRAGDAVALLAPHAESAGAEITNALAFAHYRLGELARAETLYRRVLETDADDVKALEGLGVLALHAGQPAEARRLLRRALNLDERLPIAWNSLGVAEQMLGQTDQALAAWQRALALDGRLLDALYNLGLTAAQSGRRDLARQALERFVAAAPGTPHATDLPRARDILRQL